MKIFTSGGLFNYTVYYILYNIYASSEYTVFFRNILQSVEVAEEFSFGPDPTIEEFQESQVSYAQSYKSSQASTQLAKPSRLSQVGLK